LKHHTLARRDLFEKLSLLAASPVNEENIGSLARELTAIFNDDAGIAEARELFGPHAQIEEQISVNDPGRDLWKPQIRKPFPAKRI
jgi:hypothetical protein